MSLLSDALTAHASRLNESAGETVTYVRGSTQIKNVTAVRGQTRFEEVSSEMEALVQTKSFDWLIRPACLDASGTLLEPQRGDQIITTNGDLYEVFPGADDKHWQYTDAHESMFRVHTVKRV